MEIRSIRKVGTATTVFLSTVNGKFKMPTWLLPEHLTCTTVLCIPTSNKISGN